LYEEREKWVRGVPITFACPRLSKSNVVAVQRLPKGSASEFLLGKLSQIRHDSFAEPIEVLTFKGECFVVWEHMEVSVTEIILSECCISENEIADIIYPVRQEAFLKEF
jgi:hypothetical protein